MDHTEGSTRNEQDGDGGQGLWGLGRDALFLTRHLPDLVKGGRTLAEALVYSTWHGSEPEHRFDELNLRDRESWMNLAKQVLFTAFTPLYGTVRGAGLLWENYAGPQTPPKVSYEGDHGLWDNNPFPNERWYFINGICTDDNGLKLNCQRLEATFGRPVQGIYNETNGFLVDLAECFAQRNLNFRTSSARFAAAIIKEKLIGHRHTDHRNTNNDLDVVLIGHSQGGIIVSMVLDILADDMTITDEQLAHVRCVITFGSAADEFHHPLRRRHPMAEAAAHYHDQLEGARPTHIEHFANAHDLVAQLGVLQFFRPAQEEARHLHDGYGRDGESKEKQPGRRPYAGRLFVAERKGHLFNTSYSLHEEDYQERDGRGQRPFFFQLVNRSISEADRVD